MTIHDPTLYDLIVVTRELPTAVLDGIEVFFDFTPKGELRLKERHKLIEEIRQWVISHLLPWQAIGIQAATRVSKGRKHCEPVFSGEVERRARSGETMYYGHSDSKYADPSKPNFASMKVYRKITNNKKPLLPAKHRCRVEVTLNQFGCKHFGLINPESLVGFDFRQLGPYFRLVKPEIRPLAMCKLRKWNPRMAAYLEPLRMKMAADTLISVGSHAASEEKLLIVDRKHRHMKGNKMILYRLDDLTRKFKKCQRNIKEWGSF